MPDLRDELESGEGLCLDRQQRVERRFEIERGTALQPGLDGRRVQLRLQSREAIGIEWYY